MNDPASFPGGVSVSHLRVYDFPAPDGAGLAGGGTPHLHTASAEAYVVLGGSGAVQTLSGEGYAEHPLTAGSVLWFTPGTVHRLVNDGGLEIVVIMQNSGLPEAGDAVLTFPAPVLADPAAYADAVRLPAPEAGAEAVAAAARARRDHALAGYGELRRAVELDGPGALAPLYDAAAALVRPRTGQWKETWDVGVHEQVRRTETALDALAAGDSTHLAESRTFSATADEGPRRAGMCGWLRTFPLPPG